MAGDKRQGKKRSREEDGREVEEVKGEERGRKMRGQ